VIIGIDPGARGAVAFVDSGYGFLKLDSFETTYDLYKAINNYAPKHIFLEKAQTMPRQGIVSAFTYGSGYGKILGMLEIAQLPFTLVHPRQWSRAMHVGTSSKEKAKIRSREAFQRIFPTMAHIKHDGVIDAMLIAEYGRRTLGGI